MADTIPPLEDFLAEGVEIPNEEEARRSFVVDDDTTAVRFLRKLARLDAEKKRLKEQADYEIGRVRQWLDQATKTVEGDEAFLKGALIDYHRRLRHEGKADKTYKLPAGSLVARKDLDDVQLPSTEEAVHDLVTWCLLHDRLDLLSIHPAKGAIKAAVLGDGEKVPGVSVIKADDDIDSNRYDVKPAVMS